MNPAGDFYLYRRTIESLQKWLSGRPITRELLIERKAALGEKYAAQVDLGEAEKTGKGGRG